MFNLLDRDFDLHPQMMLFQSNLFEDDNEICELRKRRREIDDKIQTRRQALIQEQEANHPARYSRKYSSSHSNINGKELSETKDVIEENNDGQKSIQQKADKIEKDNGKVVDEEHVNVKLSQDKQDKNKWFVTQNGTTTTLNATDSDFGSKLQALMTTEQTTQNNNNKEKERDADNIKKEEEEAEEEEEEEEAEMDDNLPTTPTPTPLPMAIKKRSSSKNVSKNKKQHKKTKKNKKKRKHQQKKSKTKKKKKNTKSTEK